MSRAPTTSATTLRLFTEALADLGVDWQRILRRCGIDPVILADCEARIPQDRFDRVWIVASEVTGDRCIGLHAGERVHPRAVNLFGYLMLSSATVAEGLRRVARYQGVLTGEPWLAFDGTVSPVRIRVGMEHDDPEVQAIHAEYVAPLVLHAMSWVSEKEVEPLEARFSHRPRGDPAEYQRVLRCPVSFGAARNEMALAPGVLELPSQHHNARFALLHEQFAAQLLERQEDRSTVGRVRQELAARLESGPHDLASIARRLGMSQRSLQRRLGEERTSFRAVLAALRRDLAAEHLERQGTPIAEVAYLTGFSEVSAFTRAVRRWFGRTPGQLRGQRNAAA